MNRLEKMIIPTTDKPPFVDVNSGELCPSLYTVASGHLNVVGNDEPSVLDPAICHYFCISSVVCASKHVGMYA